MTDLDSCVKVTFMDSSTFDTSFTSIYALWHIPSSTLLISSTERHEVESQIRSVLANGCQMEDLMLQVTGKEDLIGRQHLGALIGEVLQLPAEATQAEIVPPEPGISGALLG
jgi:hypothetical protein